MNQKLNLYDLNLDEMKSLFTSWGEPTYRANQTWEWLYQHQVTAPNQMTSLSKGLRSKLLHETSLAIPKVLSRQESIDGETRKDLLELSDGSLIEVVLMRYIDRRSACISTQVGCAVKCRFCATGQMGFKRHLRCGEIVSQVLHLSRELQAQDQKLTNIVLMGMGEPFLNYDQTLKAVRIMIHPKGLGIGQRRITLSTVGIVQGILRFAKEDLQVNLAVSLHAATDDVRSYLLPINRRHNLNDLFSAVHNYIERTNRRVTFEWVLIDGLTDTDEQAYALAARLSGMLAHVNLIPLNPTSDFDERPSTPERVEAFAGILDRKHIQYSLRLRRGVDIRAGCGQLRGRQNQV
jgi:23S rRNA (adenine2503-C2)-methyltransferase